MAKQQSRTDRWAEQAKKLRAAYDPLVELVNKTQEEVNEIIKNYDEKVREVIEHTFEDMRVKADDLLQNVQDAITELRDIQSEYEDWGEQKSEATRDKLDTLQSLDLDIEPELLTNIDINMEASADLDDIADLVDDVEGIELPLGFGRD